MLNQKALSECYFIVCVASRLESLTVADLRTQLEKFGEKPPSKLKKADLISLLVPYLGDNPLPILSKNGMVTKTPGTLTSDEVNQMTVQQLKDELKSRGLRVGGTRPELLQRLLESLETIKEQPHLNHESRLASAENDAPEQEAVLQATSASNTSLLIQAYAGVA